MDSDGNLFLRKRNMYIQGDLVSSDQQRTWKPKLGNCKDMDSDR